MFLLDDRNVSKFTIPHVHVLQVGDTVILVDCRQKSKRKKHKLLTIVRKLPRLDDI